MWVIMYKKYRIAIITIARIFTKKNESIRNDVWFIAAEIESGNSCCIDSFARKSTFVLSREMIDVRKQFSY